MKAKVVFNDMKFISSTIKGFNDLGKALAYVTKFNEIEELRKGFESFEASTKDRNQRARLRQGLKGAIDIASLAKSEGLQQDPTLLENLAFLLEHGFQDQFEVQMPTGGYTFSANLKREHLREDEHLLVRKYSRFSESDLVLFGTVTQSPTLPKDTHTDGENVDNFDPQDLREAIMKMVGGLSETESAFSGKRANEVIIDPIALYREI